MSLYRTSYLPETTACPRADMIEWALENHSTLVIDSAANTLRPVALKGPGCRIIVDGGWLPVTNQAVFQTHADGGGVFTLEGVEVHNNEFGTLIDASPGGHYTAILLRNCGMKRGRLFVQGASGDSFEAHECWFGLGSQGPTAEIHDFAHVHLHRLDMNGAGAGKVAFRGFVAGSITESTFSAMPEGLDADSDGGDLHVSETTFAASMMEIKGRGTGKTALVGITATGSIIPLIVKAPGCYVGLNLTTLPGAEGGDVALAVKTSDAVVEGRVQGRAGALFSATGEQATEPVTGIQATLTVGAVEAQALTLKSVQDSQFTITLEHPAEGAVVVETGWNGVGPTTGNVIRVRYPGSWTGLQADLVAGDPAEIAQNTIVYEAY